MLRSWSPDAFVSHVVAGLIGLGAGVLLCRNQHRSAKKDNDTAEETPESSLRKECGWLAPLLYEKRYCHLEEVDSTYREWEDMAWRKSRGWMGQDFVHSKTSPGPRVLRYFYDRRTSSLIGIVKFGPGSESHAGLCHGGSMCAVLDDVCGHTAFVANGTGPWSGATTRVNCQLRKPVKVNQILKVVGTVREREGRKTHIEGKLIGEDGSIHATLDGMTVAVTREQLMS